MLAGKYVIVPLAILVRITKISYISFLFSQFQQKYREVPKKSKNILLYESFHPLQYTCWNVVSFQLRSKVIALLILTSAVLEFENTQSFLQKNIVTKSKKLPSGTFNSFHATDLFLCFLKTPKNLCFFYIFRGYRKRPVAWNELKKIFLK